MGLGVSRPSRTRKRNSIVNLREPYVFVEKDRLEELYDSIDMYIFNLNNALEEAIIEKKSIEKNKYFKFLYKTKISTLEKLIDSHQLSIERFSGILKKLKELGENND